MKIKGFFLILILLVPLAIVVFLKFFGSNTYTLPLLYTDNENIPVNCEIKDYPYTLSTFLNSNTVSAENSLIVCSNIKEDAFDEYFNEVERRKPETKDFPIVWFHSDSLNHNRATNILIPEEEFDNLMECVLLLRNKEKRPVEAEYFDMLLVDKEGFIRSYYYLNSLEDQDRLLVELDILGTYGE